MRPDDAAPEINRFRAQHLALGSRDVATDAGLVRVTVDEAESPLVWLARRRGRDGLPMIAVHQLQAGERLRADFTRGQLMQRTTSNWSSPTSSGGRGSANNGAAHFTDVTIEARQRVNQALDAVGPEFSGLLVDVCCFLKGLADLEQDRGWPARSAKVVLQLGLDRLARHYGYASQAKGPVHAPVRTWLVEGAGFVVS
ncbi:MAG: DNA replication protein [Rhodopseudomonas sp.]|nr:DNA replication protein [Rhodopseudomonas sp.]